MKLTATALFLSGDIVTEKLTDYFWTEILITLGLRCIGRGYFWNGAGLKFGVCFWGGGMWRDMTLKQKKKSFFDVPQLRV
jgi:hypothetical protein